MKSIAIYNNKGGVGKSTFTLFLADFFSSNSKIVGRDSRILVIDLDCQSSSSNSLIGLEKVGSVKSEKRCISNLLLKLQNGENVELSDYLSKRKKGYTPTRGMLLDELWVMANERGSTIEFENNCDLQCLTRSMKVFKEMIAKEFDVVFIDLPANVDERNKISLLGLLLANYILVPTEPNRITLNAMADTFKLIHYVNGLATEKSSNPEIAGIVLNKTNRGAQQYRRHIGELKDMAGNYNTIIFENALPAAPPLSGASDDSQDFATLKERYATYYDNVRKVAIELEKKCNLKSA